MTGTALTVQRGGAVVAPAAPLDFGAMMQMGKVLVGTRFLPEHIKTPEQAVAIILTGQELGMAPMRALRSLAMVKGKVTESADSQLARFKSDGGRAQFVELTETRAELQLRHPNGDEHTESFTIEDARKAGLAGPGSMYTKYPKAMLRSRVITAALKSIGWEGGTGVYDPAEAAEFAPTAPRAAAGRAPAADADGVVEPGEMTLAEAKAYPFPFQKGKPQHGRAMGELDSDMLRNVEAWVREKRTEKGDPTWHADTTEAIGLILFDRDQEQGALPLGEDGPSTDDLPDPTQPGVAHAVADAVGERQAAQRAAAAADDNDLPF